MTNVTKKEGKFVLTPDPLLTARANSKKSMDKIKAKLTDEELRAILADILLRLAALDSQ